jgi:hypothetical protein
LKRIDRQSATRRGGPWKRATEHALVFSLPIAMVIAILVDEIGVTVEATPVARVRLGRDRADGPLTGDAVPLEADHAPWHFPVPVCEVLVETRTIRYGWPFAGRMVRTEPIAMASLLVAPDERVDLSDPTEVERVERLALVDLTGGWDAVADALDADPARNPVATGFREGRSVEIRMWPSTIALVGVLWILIFIVSACLIRVVQFGSWSNTRIRRNRIVKRLRNGECPDCRYDLRAERFPRRCPECGRRIWA